MSQTKQSKRKNVTSKLIKNVIYRLETYRFSVGYFLAALVMTLIIFPFMEQLPGGILIEALLLTLVMLSAVMAVSGRRRTLTWAMALAMPALVGKWVNYWRPDLMPPEVFLSAGLLFVAFIFVHLFRFILHAPRVNSEVLYAGVAIYLMLGLLWAFAYTLVYRTVPDSFAFTVGPASSHSMNGFNSLYFSFVTLSTVGYGDIIPVSGVARLLAIAEATFGMFYVTLLIARLVALYSPDRPGNE